MQGRTRIAITEARGILLLTVLLTAAALSLLAYSETTAQAQAPTANRALGTETDGGGDNARPWS